MLATILPAAAAPLLPPSAEPRPDQPRILVPNKVSPAATVVVPSATAAAAPAGAAEYRLVLKSVVIGGSTAYAPAVLQEVFKPLIGHETTVAELFRAANEIEIRYRTDGYVTTQVVVPAQTIEDGVFRVEVIEGYVSAIEYPDDIGPAIAAVRKLLDPLKGKRPVNIADVERRLLIADDLPGLTVRGTLKAAPKARGASVVVVKAERKALSASFGVNNRNTPYLGKAQATASASLDSFGPNADSLNIYGRLSPDFKRAKSIGLGYQGLLNSDGLMFSGNVSYAQSSPGLSLEPYDIDSGVFAAIATLSYPIVRSRELNLKAVGEIEYRDVGVDLTGTKFTRDHLRIARAGLSFDYADKFDGISAIRGLVHQGLPIFDATETGSLLASRADGHADFTKFTLDMTRIQQLTDQLSLMAMATAQLSTGPLLASEQLALGGGSYGRAFDDGEISGNNGVGGSLEVRYSPALPQNPVIDDLQVYAFLDGGAVWADSSASAESLFSVGAGVRTKMLDNVFSTLEISQPLTRDVGTEGDRNPRVFFSLSAQF